MKTKKFIIKIDPAELVPKSSAKLFYYGAFWLAIIQAATIALLWRKIPQTVPLFFTEPWGEGRLAPKFFLLIIPAVSFISLVINVVAGRESKEENQVIAYTLAVGSFVIVIMFTIAVFGILQSII